MSVRELAAVPPTPSRNRRWLLPLSLLLIFLLYFNWVPSVQAANQPRPKLPALTPAELVAKAKSAPLAAFSGSVASEGRLGLPSLTNEYRDGPSLLSLLSDNRSYKYRSATDGNYKLQIPGVWSEADYIRRGTDSWIWQSQGQKVTHETAAGAKERPTLTPDEIGRSLLSSVDANTKVVIDYALTVSGRDAYIVTITPGSASTLVDRARIAIDSKTYLPLVVEIWAKGVTKAAYRTGFTSIDFGPQNRDVFAFTPPKGSVPSDSSGNDIVTQLLQTAVGGNAAGWNAITVTPRLPIASLQGAPTSAATTRRSSDTPLTILDRVSTPVTGAFGEGKLIHTNLLNIVIADDGRIAYGTVDQPTLLAAIPPTN